MRLVVGLGNPGDKYLDTRHNVGFFVVETLLKLILPKDVVVRKSNVFMNQSGDFVGGLVNQYKLDLSNLYIVHDDLDIKLGDYKIQFAKEPKDHNGLKSINDRLRSSAYWHVRVGVDNRDPDDRTIGEDYVLENFTDAERRVLDKVIKTLCKKLATSLRATS